MNDLVRPLGVVFQSTSCDSAAHQLLRAAIYWGGEASLWVYRDGTAEAVCTHTRGFDERQRMHPAALVGIYRHADGEPGKIARKQVSVDIWQQMVDLAGRNTRAGQKIRAQWMKSGAA